MEENTAVLETPEVIKHTGAEWYRDVSLEDAEVFIRSNLQSAVRSVIATGFYLKHIRDNELYLEAGYKNINEYAMDRFGLSASATSRYITRNTRFSRGGNSPLIDDRFKDFSKSQLQEMLGMSDEQLEQVTPDMTVREIRNMARPKEIPYIEMLAIRSLKRTSASRTFFMKWNLPRTGTKGTGLRQAFNRAEEPGGLIKIWQR